MEAQAASRRVIFEGSNRIIPRRALSFEIGNRDRISPLKTGGSLDLKGQDVDIRPLADPTGREVNI